MVVKIRLREAVPADVDAVTDVLIASMSGDRDWWDYRFPHRAQYPDDHRHFFHQLVQAWLSADSDDWVVMVGEVRDDGGGGTYHVGAYSVWDLSYRNYRKFGERYQPRDSMFFILAFLYSSHPRTYHTKTSLKEKRFNVIPSSFSLHLSLSLSHLSFLTNINTVANALGPLPNRRDANLPHTAEHARAAHEGHATLLSTRYGTEQIHLQALGTHASVTGRGLARRLCRWGMDLATRDGVAAVTLQAAPLARAVYPRFGFVELGTVKVQVAGEEACTFLYPMAWEPGKEA